MPAWKTLLSMLALAGTAVSCAHHGDTEVVPEHEREELLKKWDQEVRPNNLHYTNPSKKKERKRKKKKKTPSNNT